MNDAPDGITSLDIDDAVDSLLAHSEPEQEADEDQEQTETDEVDAEVTDETADDETEEAEEEEVETDDDDGPEDVSDEELVYELDGEEVTAAQLKEWRDGGLMRADYTKKTQALSEDRATIEANRQALDAERQAVQQERAQLQDALATLAIDVAPEPDWVALSQTLPVEQFQQEQALWNAQQQKKQKAQQIHQALQQQTHSELVQREQASLFQKLPDWRDPVELEKGMGAIVSVAGEYGFSQEELAGIVDHRQICILKRLSDAEAELAKVTDKREMAKKKVIKAQPKRRPGARVSQDQVESKTRKQQQAKLKKTGSLDDAVSLLMADLNS